jgi:peptidoglycan/LPS O-acetylase OafA/YrhL
LAALGLSIVLAACVALRSDIPFPGAVALMPCVGAALLIWTGAGPGTAVSRALSWGPLRWVGGLSFSLYLWHWPALISTRHALLAEPNAWQAGVAVAVAVLMLTVIFELLVDTPLNIAFFVINV